MPNKLSEYDNATQRKIINEYMKERGGNRKSGAAESTARQALGSNPELLDKITTKLKIGSGDTDRTKGADDKFSRKVKEQNDKNAVRQQAGIEYDQKQAEEVDPNDVLIKSLAKRVAGD